MHACCVLSRFSHVQLFATLQTGASQAPPSMGGKNTGVGCHALLQGIFSTQGSNLRLLHLLRWPVSALPFEYFQQEYIFIFSQSVSSVTQLCPTLCAPMNCSTPDLPVHHKLPEFTQTHAHRVGDAIQPSHPLSSPSPPAPNPSQHQGLFQ